ncbi:anthranilate phosphoribosyltransferase [Pilibacter termitis]|uniref:Anthranilate phosphoribosyltransferase n=1 Tax=Pilibacter termitis TaxID=263852 RepID=A0A1T4QCA8_9ENTE|nr:anthranilate phosphoribosyltransferase [Pilibacter termitis]SKA01314.1 anthranilate phosphoribosyltransferase [Pilibacter termitis]
MKGLLEKIIDRENLNRNEILQVGTSIFQGELTDAQVSSFLIALKMKGESAVEMAGLAEVIQRNATKIPTKRVGIMDNCGTGGDRSFSFNVSTTSAFVLASGGVNMAKHGNRSISSKSGSADVLETLGINLYLPAERLGEILDETGLVFLFAQHLHPNMRFITGVRRELEIPTIMNLIGPLTNPVPLEYQLMGTSRRDLIAQTAETLKELGRKRAVVISGPENMDEASLSGVNQYALLENGEITLHEFDAASVGLKEISVKEIRGGEPHENAEILKSVLKGENSPYKETTLLNAGLGFYAADKATTVKEGIELARELLDNGVAYQKLEEMQRVQRG